MNAGVVAALAAEARALGTPARGDASGVAMLSDGTLLAVSGIGCAAAARTAERLIAAGASALVSWGVAGALDPELAVGTICLPSEVIAADGARYCTAARWRDGLAERIAAQRPVSGGRLLTRLQAVDSAAAKALAHGTTGAAAVDMESGAIAQVAAAHGLPFIAVRVIVDAAADRVPGAVAAASRAGEVRIARLVWGLMLSPTDIAPLVGLARRYRVARRSLRAVAGLGKLAPPSREAASGARVA